MNDKVVGTPYRTLRLHNSRVLVGLILVGLADGVPVRALRTVVPCSLPYLSLPPLGNGNTYIGT